MSKKCKILHLQLLPILSGVQNVMLQLLQELDGNKYEISVASKPDGPLVKKVEELGFRHEPISWLRRKIGLWDFLSFWQLYSLFKKNKYDIVHTHSSKTGFLGRFAAKLAGIDKIVHTVHGFPFNDAIPFPIHQFYQFMEIIAGKVTDQMIFVNEFERKLAINKKIANPFIAHVIHNGMDVNYDFAKTVYPGLEGKTVIGFVGRFDFPKNVLTIVKAATYALRQNDNIAFIFVGDGDDWQRCNDYIHAENVVDSIKLVGWQTDIHRWLSYFDALVLFSLFEGLPVSVLEAMSVGLPIIASNVKGCNELVDDSNGVLIDIDRVDKLISVFAEIDKMNLEEMGRKSLQKVELNFNKSKFIKKHIEVYEC